MIYLRNIKNLRPLHLSYSYLKHLHIDAKNHGVRKKLMEILGVTGSKLKTLSELYPQFKSIDLATIKENEYHLHTLNIQQEQIRECPQILTMLPVVLEQRGLLLEELGLNEVTPPKILKFFYIVKKRISLLKSYDVLPKHINVVDRLYSYLEPPPEYAEVIPKLTDQNTLLEVYTAIRQHYIVWKLEFPDVKSYDHIQNTYHRLKHRSFRSTCETLDLLQNEIGFDKNRIRLHGYLLHSHPKNTRNILNRISSLGGLPIRDVLIKYPKIVLTNVKTILETQKILKEYNIPDEAIRNCYNIFTLSSNSVLSRLQENQEIPEFNALSSNIRVLKLVNHQRKAKVRLDYLHKLNMRNASLHVLSSTNSTFTKYITEGADKTRGDDVVYYLEHRFSEKDGTVSKDLRTHLLKHPFWFHVPLVQVRETFEYLLKKFKPQDIQEAIQIVLYPKGLIEQEMQKVRNTPELDRKWLSPVQELNLCLYFIEKPHHFSGDGIWTNESEKLSSH